MTLAEIMTFGLNLALAAFVVGAIICAGVFVAILVHKGW